MSEARARIRKGWLATFLTILIGVSAAVSIDRLQARSDARREGQLLLAQVENAASRQALVTLDALSLAVGSEGRNGATELAVRPVRVEVGRLREKGFDALERLTELGVADASTTEAGVAFRRFQTEIDVAVGELEGGNWQAAYIYGLRRIEPTFDVIEDSMDDSTVYLGQQADNAHHLARFGGLATLLTAITLLLVLRRRWDRERRRFEAKLQHEALHDPLTDLPNRRLFQDRVERASSRWNRGHGSALLYIDLDGFKQVNDQKGHDAGDRLLTAVAQRLQDCVRSSDTVARIGGDEFAIVLSDVTQPVEVIGLADRIMDALVRPVDLGSSTACIGASIGIAIQVAGETPEELCTRADAAMYSAKRSGRGSYCIAPGTLTDTPAPLLGRFLVTA